MSYLTSGFSQGLFTPDIKGNTCFHTRNVLRASERYCNTTGVFNTKNNSLNTGLRQAFSQLFGVFSILFLVFFRTSYQTMVKVFYSHKFRNRVI